MKNKKYERFIILSSVFILIFSLVIVFSFNFTSDGRTTNTNGGWQLQTNLQTLLNGRTITDMTFIDSITGFAVTTNKTPGDTGYIFKTTNGGYNWFVNFMPSKYFTKIYFLNDSIGFACGGSGGGTSYFCKTTDKGNNWIGASYGASLFNGMSVLNKDTIYLCDDDGLVGGVFRSFNGGLNWQQIYSAGMYNPQDIYMFNERIGFYSSAPNFYRTTNGGYVWSVIDNQGFLYCHFLDTLTGYRINFSGNILKSINGGINWIAQTLPIIPGGSNVISNQKLHFINKDTIWSAGSSVWYPNPGRYRGILNKTTNGGLNWGYQIPDTHFVILQFSFISFYKNNYGWAYDKYGKGIYTTTGGDSTIYVGINQNNENIPGDYALEQNYPNPFNPVTKIKFSIPPFNPPLIKGGRGLSSGGVSLKVYDILGKEIATLVNESLNPGTYEVDWDASNYPSGIYFYRLTTVDFSETKRMILLK